MTWNIRQGDVLDRLREMPDESVQCCVTSPPYWGLRDYGVDGQIGLEASPDEHITKLVEVFREVRRVLRSDGVLWLNYGDAYAAAPNCGQGQGGIQATRSVAKSRVREGLVNKRVGALKPKDLIGLPWRLARALQEPYYTGKIRDERDRVWLAAMLDAEGCMFIHRRKAGQSNGQGYERKTDSFGPGVEIANTSLAVIERIMQIVGKGSICSQGPEENGRRKQRIYRWNLRTTECREFVRELYPHLVAKQQQARILIGCPSSGDRAAAAHAALISLHRTGSSDVDFPDPASLFEPGWYLRSDVIWSKANPMPESVTDRPTRAHEYVFLLSKSARYFYDAEAIRETATSPAIAAKSSAWRDEHGQNGVHRRYGMSGQGDGRSHRNARTVWTINPQPTPEAHFATFPEALAERCILAGTSAHGACSKCGAPWERVTGPAQRVEGRASGNTERKIGSDHIPGASHVGRGVPWHPITKPTVGWSPTCDCRGGGGTHGQPYAARPCLVLDLFAGSGTTLLVAERLGRDSVGIELNPEYVAIAERRIRARDPMAPVEVAPGMTQPSLFGEVMP